MSAIEFFVILIDSITKGSVEMKRNREKNFTKLLCGSLLAAVICFCAGCGRTVKYTSANTAMGTFVYQTVYTSGEDVTADVTGLINGLEQDTLSWRIAESEIARINARTGSGEGFVLSDNLRADLEVLREVSERSNGAFDITMHPVVELWNIDAWAAGQGVVPMQQTVAGAGEIQDNQPSDGATSIILPDQKQVTQALSHTGYEEITIENNTLYLPAEMSLDLGAAGKGIACDEIAEFLKESKVSGAVISVGGSVLTYGRKPDGMPWQVAIVNPLDTATQLGTLSLTGEWFVSTSGDYERYVEVDGIRYHHILDPATGYPATSGVRSVTIVCDSGILSDALSTACFVLGVEDGMELAESYGVRALFVDEAGRIFMTESMRGIFEEAGEQ
ncbi:MAG: FAD:protein FMN transferase [Clostridia bacterium]|nr:FAD:protein FMN transferase [Clostridia bacterium]